MALNSLLCADVPLSTYTLTLTNPHPSFGLFVIRVLGLHVAYLCTKFNPLASAVPEMSLVPS